MKEKKGNGDGKHKKSHNEIAEMLRTNSTDDGDLDNLTLEIIECNYKTYVGDLFKTIIRKDFGRSSRGKVEIRTDTYAY